MKNRCYLESNIAYKNYGGRGIKVCDEWLDSFISFYNWAINNGYRNDLTIDRINNNENYYPKNCKWSTYVEQSNNRRDTVYIELDGETKNISEWSKITGISHSIIWQRYHKSNTKTKEELFKPAKKYIKIVYNNEEKTLPQLSRETGIGLETLRWRYNQGYREEELTKPVLHRKSGDTA